MSESKRLNELISHRINSSNRHGTLSVGFVLDSFCQEKQIQKIKRNFFILTSPRLSAAVLEFTPVDERVASLRLRAGGKL